MSAVAAGPVLTFREAAAADVPEVVALVESAYRGDVSRAGWTTEADFLDGQRVDVPGVTELVTKPRSRILLAMSDARMLACCHIEKHGSTCYFGMFAVSPMQQGGGIGRRMLAEAERVARTLWNCVKMEMTVISIRTDLIPWYERRGYRRSGEFKRFPYGDDRFGIPRRDDLQFELLIKDLK